MRLNRRQVLLSVFLFTLFQSAKLQTYEDALRPFWYSYSAGATPTGMSSDLTASSRNRLSFYSNPATLGLVNRTHLMLSFQNEVFQQDARLNFGYDSAIYDQKYYCDSKFTPNSSHLLRFDGFGLTYPIPVYRGSWVIGIAYAPAYTYLYNLHNNGIVPLSDGEFTLEQNLTEDGAMYALKIGTAVEFQRNLFLGYSLNWYNGFRNYNYSAIDRDNLDQYTYAEFRRDEIIKPTYRGWNFDLGFLWNHSPFIIGARITSPIYLKVKEASRFIELETADNNSTSFNADTHAVKYKLSSPLEWAFGCSYEIGNILITTELSYRDWRNLDFSSDLYLPDTTRLDPVINADIAQFLRATWNYSIGINLPITQQIHAQLGYRALPRPYKGLKTTEDHLSQISLGLEMAIDPQIICGISYQLTRGEASFDNTYFQVVSQQKTQQRRLTFSTAILL